MSDIVNAFKQKSSKKRANWQSEDSNNAIQELQQKRQDNTIQQQTQDNKALESARQQNVQNQNTTSYSDKLVALQQAAAAEQAQNAANAAAQQQAQQTQQQNQTTTQTTTKDNDGWKKYYDSEKQKVREQAQKNNAFDTWLQDVFNSGWDTRLAETQARNKYANELINQSMDESGNVTDQNKLNEAQQFTAYNSDVAKNYSDYEHARGNMYGATAETKDQNLLKSTANAIRNMDVGSAIVGSNDVEGTEGAKYNNLKDVGRFLANLLPGMANAPTTGFTNVSEALSGKGTNYDTGLEEDLDALERVGRGASGAVDVAGTFFGGSKDLINSVSNALFKKGATEAAKQATKQTTKGAIKELTKAMLEEGSEEAAQQAAEFFGNGGKLVTSDGEFDQDSFNDLLKETAQAGALGAVGGGIFHIGSKGIDALASKIKTPKAPDAGEVSNINNRAISEQTRNENAAQTLREAEGNAVENPAGNVGENLNEETTTQNTTQNTNVTQDTDVNEPSEALRTAITNINNLSNSQYNLSQDQLTSMQNNVQNISEQIRNGQLSEEEGIRMINELRNNLLSVSENQVVEPQETSATGQKVNPQDVSNVVTEAQGTQASAAPAEVKTDITENRITEPKQTYNISDGRKYEDQRNTFDLGKKNLKKGVELADGFAEDPNGYEQTAVEDDIPIAYDYSNGQYLYFLNDVYNALDANGGVDVNGVAVETPSAMQTRLADEKAKSNWERLKDWNEQLKQQRLNNEISQYEYESQLELPSSREDMEAYGKYYDPAYIKTLGVTGDYGDESIPPIWGNNYRGQALDVKTAEQQLNDLVNTANNVEQEYAQNETTEEPTENTDNTQEQTPRQTMTRQELQNRWDKLTNEYNGLMDENLSRKIQSVADMNASVDNPVDLSNLTPEELTRYRQTLEKLHKANVVDNVDEAMARGYLPQQYSGTQNVDSILDEFNQFDSLGKWWNNGRTGAVASSGDMDYTNAPIVSWHIRGENPQLVKKASAENYLHNLNPEATNEQLSAAADDMASAIDELNTNANRGTGGDAESSNGDKNNPGVLTDADIKKMNIGTKLESAGEKAGIQKNVINDAPRGLSDDVRLQSLDQWDNNAMFGYAEHIDAYANNTADDVNALITNKFQFLTDEQRQKILNNRDKLMETYLDIFGNDKIAEFATNRKMIKNAFAQNILNYAMQTKFTNQQTRDLMNDCYTRYLLQDRMEQSVGQKIGSGVQRLMNSAFRGMRLQTTLNEIPEIVKSLNDFNTMHITVKPSEIRQVKAKYGFTDGKFFGQDQGTLENVLQKLPKEEQAQARAELENARDLNQQMTALQKIGQRLGKVADNFDTLTQWNAFIQNIKDATYLANAEKFYSEQGLTGTDLTNAVLSAYDKRMLPQSRVFKILKSDKAWMKPFTLYMDSNLRLTRQFAEGAVGMNDVGVNKNKSRAQRIARNAATDIAPRAIAAMIMGVPFAAVAGIFQLGGDYSGIEDEDKTVEDRIVNFLGQFSPLLSVFTYWYNQNRQEQINDEDNYNPTDLRGDANTRALNNALKTFTPVGNWLDQTFGTFGNQNSTAAVLDRGYGVNKSGRTTYINETGTPADLINNITALIGGTNMTSGAREYNNNPNLLSAIINELSGKDYDNDGTIEGGFSDFIKYNNALQNPLTGERPLVDEDDYNRPASESTSHNYNEKIQEAMNNGDTAKAQEWYEKSREYNSILDKLRVENKDAYDVYESSWSKDIVSPEKYARIAYGNSASDDHSAESIDLTVWNTMKELALKQRADFGGNIDPAYTDLDDEQTREYLQYKSTATGDDILLKKEMCVDDFWDSFFDRQSDYYSSLNYENDDSEYSQRVQQWNDYNDQYSDYMKFISGKVDSMDNQELALQLTVQFPLMYEYQSLKTALKSKYGDDWDDSTEYKAFWSQNYDAYQEESEAFNTQVLYIINQMRGIEGYDEMTLDQLEAINEFGYEDEDDSGYSSSSSSSYSYAPQFENIFSATPLYTKNYHTKKSVTANLAGKPSFESIDFSSAAGYDPYNSVV